MDELRAQLNQMENMTTGKNQDLEDAVEECKSDVSCMYRATANVGRTSLLTVFS